METTAIYVEKLCSMEVKRRNAC